VIGGNDRRQFTAMTAKFPADTSWTLLLPDVDRLIFMVIRKAVLGRNGRFLFDGIRDDYLVVCSA
jgi:hypothetical protein